MKKIVSTISEIMGVSERKIEVVLGNKEERTNDTYSFTMKGVYFNQIGKLIREIPSIDLANSIVTETKVTLRIK